MPRVEFDPGSSSRTDPRLLLLVVPFVAAVLFDRAALFLQRSIFPPAGEMGGPLFPGLLLWPGLFLAVYILVSFLAVRPRTFPFIDEYVRAFFTGKHGALTIVVLTATVLASFYGFFATWDANSLALTRHPNLWSAQHTYDWPEVRTVTLQCGGRGISPVQLEITLADGASVDLGQANQSGLKALFPAIAKQIRKAHSGLGRVRTCPAFLGDFISERRVQNR